LPKFSEAERRAIIQEEAELRARQRAAAAELPAADRREMADLKIQLQARQRLVLLSPCERSSELAQPALAVLKAHDALGATETPALPDDASYPTAAETRALATFSLCDTGPATMEMMRNVVALANHQMTWGEYRRRDVLPAQRLHAAMNRITGTLDSARRAAARQAEQWVALAHLLIPADQDIITPADRAEGLVIPYELRKNARLAEAAPSPPASTPLPAAREAAVLLVTWLVNDQPPSSYQTAFNSMADCERARAKVLAENARLAKQQGSKRCRNGGVDTETWWPVHSRRRAIRIRCLRRSIV
jgi:hypothetical protein